MKVINLILYSLGDECYEMMAEALTKYLQAQKIEHYFYSYKSDLENDFIFKDNHLFIKGTETMIPGVLEKTLQALEIFQDRDYDFIVRTNVSTIVDFSKALQIIPRDCDFAAFMFHGWGTFRSMEYGVTDENYAKYHTHVWPQGIFVVLSRKVVGMLIKDREILHAYGMVDDRVIGSYFHERVSQISRACLDWSKMAVNATQKMDDICVYRNKSENRVVDVCRMNAIIKQLMENDS